MPGRSYTSGNTSYRFGFNGKELDKEVIQYDYGFRIYDARLGRFKSVDPLREKYPWNSTYAFAENDVIRSIDLDGLEKKVVIHWIDKVNDDGTLHISKTSVSIDQNANFDGWGQPSNEKRNSGSVFALTETYYYMMNDKKLYKGKDLLENSNVNNVNPPPSAQYDYTQNVMEKKAADDIKWAGWNLLKHFRLLERDIVAPDNAMTVEDVSMGMLAFTSVVGTSAMVKGMLKAEGVAVEGANAGTTAATEQSFTKVGRWMSKEEHAAMLKTGRVQEGGGGVTYSSTEGADYFRKVATRGSVYVEYEVPTNSLVPGQPGAVRNVGPAANATTKAALKKQGGEMLPAAKNISQKPLEVKQ